MVYLHKGALPSNKNEQTSDIHNNMYDPQDHYELSTKENML